MCPVMRIVNRVFLALGLLTLFVITLLFIGVRWGLTPLPKPPAGVRLQPLLSPITTADLKPDNGAYDYMKAVALLQTNHWNTAPNNLMEAVTAGIFTADTNAIEQTLREYQPVLELLRKGVQAPSCQMPRIDPATDDTTMKSLRPLARLLIADGKWAEHNGHLQRALDDYLTAVKFGTDCAKGGTMLPFLIGDAIVSMGSQALQTWVLQSAISTNELRTTKERLDAITERKEPFAEALRYELILIKEEVRPTLFSEPKPWWWPVSESVTLRCFDAEYGVMIQDAEKPIWESQARAIEARWAVNHRRRWYWVLDRPVPRILLSMLLPAFHSPRVKSVRAEVELEATSVICAIKSYELAHGSPPESLSALVPDLRPAIPTDPFDGKPLRYRREGKEWVLWSVGSDMKDDNAAWHEYKYRTANDERRGGDIYFKSTEPQDDLAWELAHGSRVSSVNTSTQ
jgi:hypothetical protein